MRKPIKKITGKPLILEVGKNAFIQSTDFRASYTSPVLSVKGIVWFEGHHYITFETKNSIYNLEVTEVQPEAFPGVLVS